MSASTVSNAKQKSNNSQNKLLKETGNILTTKAKSNGKEVCEKCGKLNCHNPHSQIKKTQVNKLPSITTPTMKVKDQVKKIGDVPKLLPLDTIDKTSITASNIADSSNTVMELITLPIIDSTTSIPEESPVVVNTTTPTVTEITKEEVITVDPALLNGMTNIIYEQYNEEFLINSGSITQAEIDEVYCLTFVMPNCLLHLSEYKPEDKRKKEISGDTSIYLKEDPVGTYHGLQTDKIYYVYVEQESERLLKDQEAMRLRLANMDKNNEGVGLKPTVEKDDGRNFESCSCLYGNPCVDEYGCKDWANRAAIAAANGWKGF